MSSVAVTVYCTVYNHEKYLRQCLDSLTVQKTNFEYEIIVHDDASTDDSPKIIREYEEKFPNLFKVVYQKVNQYSQGTNIFTQFIEPILQGKYIAFCEGDDYWVDPYKLQKQYDIMEKNPDCTFAIHNVACVMEDGQATNQTLPQKTIPTSKISPCDFISLINTYFFQLTSYFFRSDTFIEYSNSDLKKVTPAGDRAMLLYASSKGNAFYLDEIMSHYRMMANGSWSNRIWHSTDKRTDHCRKMITMLQTFNQMTNYQFNEPISKRILQNKRWVYQAAKGKKEYFNRDYFNCLKVYSFKQRLGILLSDLFPKLFSIYKERAQNE